MHWRGDAHLPRFFPPRGAEAPFVTRFQTRKPKLRTRRDQVIPALKTILQEFRRHRNADRVQPLIHRACIAAPIAKEARQRIVAAGFEIAAKDIA